MNADHVRDAYSSVADLYISLFGTPDKSDDEDLAFIARHLTGPGRVLDVGCGPGHLTAYLRAQGVDATGVDMVPEFLAHARAAHPTGVYEQGDLRSLNAEDGSVAGILAWYSLIHLPPDDMDGVLAELRRVSAPGATLVVGFFDGEEVVPFAHKVTTAYFWPPDELSKRLAGAGFRETARVRRPVDGTHRVHAALACKAEGRG